MYQDSVSAEPGSQPGETGEASAAGVSAEIDRTADSESADPRGSMHTFRDELARAMHAAAEHERLRIEARVDDDATAHIEKVRSRALAEAGELKQLAEDDVAGIRGWAKSEIERIRTQADVQITERRERLEQHLVSHATIIDGEVDRVSEAIEGYRHELAAFFARMSEQGDPSEIARLADAVPTPPDFAVIRAVARAEAVDRLSRLEDDASSAAEGAEASGPAEAAPAASSESAEASAGERELVPVMDPALASSSEASAPEATAETADAASAATPSSDEAATTDGAAPVEATAAAVPVAEAPVADMAATAGEPAEGQEAAESSEPVGAAVGSGDTNPATRFIRSITSWGSVDHGSGDLPK